MSVNLRGAATRHAVRYQHRLRRQGPAHLIEYGNNTATAYTYDPLTFRLTNLTTTRLGFPASEQTVQDLAYTYDPVGNITHIQDDADIQNVVFFRNRRVEPSNDYTYDAIYRLIQASGREQLGLMEAAVASVRDFLQRRAACRICLIPAMAMPWGPTPSSISMTPSATSAASCITAPTRESGLDALLHLQRSQPAGTRQSEQPPDADRGQRQPAC